MKPLGQILNLGARFHGSYDYLIFPYGLDDRIPNPDPHKGPPQIVRRNGLEEFDLDKCTAREVDPKIKAFPNKGADRQNGEHKGKNDTPFHFAHEIDVYARFDKLHTFSPLNGSDTDRAYPSLPDKIVEDDSRYKDGGEQAG